MDHIQEIVSMLSGGILTEQAKPGKIVFKRGTVINADHIAFMKQGYKASLSNRIRPYLLIGLGPTFIPMRETYSIYGDQIWIGWALKNNGHPDFWGVRKARTIHIMNPADDWEDEFKRGNKVIIGRYFKKIFTANLENITNIDGIPPQEWILRHSI